MEIRRKVDELGRVVIPIDARKQFDIKKGDKYSVTSKDNYIIFEKNKKEGTIRTIDELGRIVIPIDERNKLEIKEGDSLRIEADDESITLIK